MRCILNDNTDPCFNLAAEEYLLKNFKDDCFMLYRNDNAIIVGKHQNAMAEINHDVVQRKNIKVVRRISGGGTVYHDLGNLNFMFIASGQEGKLVDFKKYTEPILEALREMGLDARAGKRNELIAGDKKFSGNAEHVWKMRTLHHGTLLFSSDLEQLNAALKVNPLRFSDKAVKSVRSRVTNIKDLLNERMDIIEFRNRIMDYILEHNKVSFLYEFSEKDLEEIARLGEEKFSTKEWNYGYSPKYSFKKKSAPGGIVLEVNLEVEKGLIRKCRLMGGQGEDLSKELAEKLVGQPHEMKNIEEILKENVPGIIKGMKYSGEWINAFF